MIAIKTKITHIAPNDIQTPGDWEQCKVTSAGSSTVLTAVAHRGTGSPCRKISAESYVDVRSGEVFDYVQRSEVRAQNLESLSKTMQRLRLLISANCTDASRVRWVTLTYALVDGKPMTDVKRVYDDYKRLMTRLRRWCSGHGCDSPEYIVILEPQGSGAWHLHCLWIWQTAAPFIPKNADVQSGVDTLESMWGQGFVRINACSDADNIAAYVSCYLTDIPLDEDINSGDDRGVIVEKNGKRIVKGGRLKYYPAGTNLYRASRGIVRPVDTWMTFADAKKIAVTAGTVTACTQTVVSFGEDTYRAGDIANTVTKYYYSTKK